MAAVPLFACDPATGWYDFTYSLSWSHQCEVAEVLSDIPFISVGILVLGVSALFLVMKRVTLSIISLFFSTLLAFVAAALDLGQILADGVALNTTIVASGHVIRAREVLLALSNGFRFLFYWTYVAEPSRKHLFATTTQRTQRVNFLIFEWNHGPHNGSWTRWGLPGKLVGSCLLVAIILITALQVVWRVVPQSHQYGSVYATDAALELLVSFVLLLKLLLNAITLNPLDSMLLHTFSECLAPISGLLVNIAIAVGDLLYFAFTESTVGRLLQAFEVYIIVVFVMVTALLRHRDILLLTGTTSSQGKKRRDVSPPLIEAPRMSTIFGIATRNNELSRQILRHSAHRSRREDEEFKLWNDENVKVEPLYAEDMELRASVGTLTQESKEGPDLVRDASANARSMEDSIQGDQTLHASRADISRCTIPLQVRSSSVPVSSVLSSIPRAKHAESMATPPEASLVYGLDSIQSLASASNPRMSPDDPPRQQNQSMEALRSFSTATSTNPSYPNPVLNDRSVYLTRSPSTGQKTVCSDVSLSNFPIPPSLTTGVPPVPPSGSSSIKRIRGERRVRLAAVRPTPIQDTCALIPPENLASLVDIPGSPRLTSIPHTPTGEENESVSAEAGKFSDSYNVPSFIGDLTVPGGSCQGNQVMPRWPTEDGSFVGTIETGSDTRKLPPYIPPVPRQPEGPPAVAKLSPFARSSRDVVDERNDRERSLRSLIIALSPQIPVLNRAENVIETTE